MTESDDRPEIAIDPMTPLTASACGFAAYEAYGNAREWTAYNGQHIPAWEDVSEPIQEAWIVAAVAVLDLIGMNVDD